MQVLNFITYFKITLKIIKICDHFDSFSSPESYFISLFFIDRSLKHSYHQHKYLLNIIADENISPISHLYL